MDKTFEEHSRGNVANILNFYYKSNMDVPQELLNVIDFKEEFERKFDFKFSKSKREELIHVKETNIINCLKNLDFPVYEKYMDINWVYDQGYKGDSHFIRTALFYNKKEALNKSLELVEKELEKQEVTSDLGNRDLERGFFSEALNLASILNMHKDYKGNEEDLKFKYDFFKKSLKLFNKYYTIRGKLWGSEKEVDFEEWHKNMDKMRVFLGGSFHGQSSLNEILVENKKYFSILKDAFYQYSENDKDPLGKPLNPFGNHTLIKLGMKNGNVNYLNLAIKNNNNQQLYSFTYDSFLEDQLNKFTDIFTNSNWSTYVSFPSFKIIKSVNDCLVKNGIKVQYDDVAALALLSAEGKDAFTLLNEIPNIKKEQIKDGLSISQLSYLKDITSKIEGFNKKAGGEKEVEVKIFKNEKEMFVDMFPSFEIYLIHKAKDFVPTPNLTLEQKQDAVAVAIQNPYAYFNQDISKEQANIILSKILLDEELSNKEDKKVTKIKI